MVWKCKSAIALNYVARKCKSVSVLNYVVHASCALIAHTVYVNVLPYRLSEGEVVNYLIEKNLDELTSILD